MPHPLYEKLKERILGYKGYKQTTDDGQYFAADNGKRFVTFNCEVKEYAWLGIREDGDTRTVFNGCVYSVDDYIHINSLVR